MILSLSEQTHLFIVSIVLGVKIFVLYDFFKALRKTRSYNNVHVHLQDFIFIIVVTIYSFYLYLYESNGAIRIYYFIGIGLGSLVYLLTISKLVVALLYKFILIIEKSIIKFWRICLLPVKFIIKLINPYIKLYRGKVGRKIKKSKKYIGNPKKYTKKRLKNVRRMIKIILEKV